MNYARIEHSERLQRVLAVLEQGPATTFDIISNARVCAVNSAICELRENGYDISCDMHRHPATKEMIAVYTLIGRKEKAA